MNTLLLSVTTLAVVAAYSVQLEPSSRTNSIPSLQWNHSHMLYHARRLARSSGSSTPSDNRTNKTTVLQDEIPSSSEVTSSLYEEPEYACDETNSLNWQVYCQGDLLHAVMMLGIFDDSKTFVDKPLKRDPEEIVARFRQRFPGPIRKKDYYEVKEFVMENFGTQGSELAECELTDWKEEPEELLTIDDINLRQFALAINMIWKKLCRTIKREVLEQPQRFSLIYVPNEFVVPGGRFREFYYWDTYWIIKGLLTSGMHQTTKRMILNFAYLIEQNGFIPNGGRVYYLRRSQPPMFIPMVYEYYSATRDDGFLVTVLDSMEKELSFWKRKRSVQIMKNEKTYTVYRYRSDTNTPRPESYREDYETAGHVSSDQKRKLWRDIASGAESGWDFSSRWFADRRHLQTIETSDIIPVDLNALICWNMGLLAQLHGHLGNISRRDELQQERSQFVDTFRHVFYNDKVGMWFDVNIKTGEYVNETYPSIAVPLFTECYQRFDKRLMYDVIDTLQRRGLLGYPGGVPTSMIKGTDQQWDSPNGWAPINHMIIEGLRKSNNHRMQQKALEVATKWINRNYETFVSGRKMWEKYDVEKEYISQAKGGEYENQAGFGWTNGVALDLLVTYGKQMKVVNSAETREDEPNDTRQILRDIPTNTSGLSMPSRTNAIKPSVLTMLAVSVIVATHNL